MAAACTSRARNMAPDQALQELMQGNGRFVGAAPVRVDSPAARAIEGQAPFAAILGCSDARVPVELIFNQGFNDLFVVRVAGNIIGPNELASLQYAALHLRVPLIMVLGHTFCGAITAALVPKEERTKEPAAIQRLLQQIDPALAQMDASAPLAERVASAVAANAQRIVVQLKTESALRRLVRDKRLLIAGAVYDLHSGRVALLPEQDQWCH
ncbi:carbonic anhydrase [candidate division KSB1 bacterium]|nr:carbonic anhydrase [candidate division KSB1 bacterium]